MDGSGVTAGVPQLPATGRSDFTDVVYADPAWVRAEFDEIIAANFGAADLWSASRPPRTPRPVPARRGRSGAGPSGFGGDPTSGNPAPNAREIDPRERAPPPHLSPQSDQSARPPARHRAEAGIGLPDAPNANSVIKNMQ